MNRINTFSNHLILSSCSSNNSSILLSNQSDLSLLNDILTKDQKEFRIIIQKFIKENIQLENLCNYYENAQFPFYIISKMKLYPMFVGVGLHGYSCSGKDIVSAGLLSLELGKKDAGIATFLQILQTISMVAIYKCGNEEQKQKYLPQMVSLEKIGCFGLTEPNAGSDAANLQTTAKKIKDGWILNGQKRWIGNGTIADISIIWARDIDNNNVLGFIVEKGTKGLSSTAIPHKIGFRCVQNADIFLDNCFVKEENRLPKSKSFATGPGQCLFLTRLNTAWIACGMALGTLEATLDYIKTRKQFNVPLAKFQIIQDRIGKIIGICQSLSMFVWRISIMCDNNKLSLGQVGLCKAYATSQTRIVVSLAREIIGGNGMITDSIVGKHFVDIEALHTFEGTYDINTLIGVRELTGIGAIKP